MVISIIIIIIIIVFKWYPFWYFTMLLRTVFYYGNLEIALVLQYNFFNKAMELFVKTTNLQNDLRLQLKGMFTQ